MERNGLLLFRRLRATIQKIPYEYGVIMRTADNLEFIKLQSEYTTSVLLKKNQTNNFNERIAPFIAQRWDNKMSTNRQD